MKSFLKQYGTSIFVSSVVGIITVAATPIGSGISNTLQDKVTQISDIDLSEPIGTYNNKEVSFITITSKQTLTDTIITDTSNYIVELTYANNEIEDVTSNNILIIDESKSIETDSSYIMTAKLTLDNTTVEQEVEVDKYTPIYVGYNSTSKTLIFSNKEDNAAYQTCDEKYDDISRTCDYDTHTSRPWYSYRAEITTINFENIIQPVSTAYWFSGFTNAIEVKNISNLDTSKVINMKYMFYQYGYNTISELDLGNNFDTSNVTDMTGMFQQCGVYLLESLNFGENFNTSNVTSMSKMFQNCGSKKMTSLNLSKFNTSKVTDMSYMFQNCGTTAMATLDLGSEFNTSNVENMSYMFDDCGFEKLETLNLGNKFNTSKVTNMQYMFSSCGYASMTKLDLGGNFDTSSVKNMDYMFVGCGYKSMAELDLGDNFNTSSVTNMRGMFQQCGHDSLIKLDLGSLFNTLNVIDMSSMFSQCGYSNLIELKLGDNFDTSNVTNMRNMFKECGSKASTTIYLGKFNPSNTVKSSTNKYSKIFYDMSKTDILYFDLESSRDWVSGLSSSYKPSAWTTDTNLLLIE